MSSARAPPGSLSAADAGKPLSAAARQAALGHAGARAAVTGAVRGQHDGPHDQEDEVEKNDARGVR